MAHALYTPVHKAADLSMADMASAAQAYANLTQSPPRITTMADYTWAGGICGLHEIGAHQMGADITAT